ncbi:2-amino-4-hydroxy-6-hydroxymethyldihydropteridine diphosphokinase [Microbacterium karelineae]|uniref:2-amino-4-hydroxy-6- hydroxymethyldihydropteridine diphosphokinase n=1 Tax=Microbacterium karelineae TaxID=2654283 RepID=UPI0012EA1348|nr:2-amino-4-hydroxy-6-hydroxymethyldihydropteridine diphosphokinase [Microbacterium karelineae]
MSRRLAEPIRDAPAHLRPVAAVVALGANLGDTAGAIADATAELRALPLTASVVCSEPIESVAVTLDGPDPSKPGYLNAVALVRTRLAPSLLLRALHDIEERHGRVRRERWDDRTLDLDLIAYGDVASDDPRLLLPHPRAHERDFVLGPWAQVDPGARLPGRGPVADLLAALRAEGAS